MSFAFSYYQFLGLHPVMCSSDLNATQTVAELSRPTMCVLVQVETPEVTGLRLRSDFQKYHVVLLSATTIFSDHVVFFDFLIFSEMFSNMDKDHQQFEVRLFLECTKMTQIV